MDKYKAASDLIRADCMWTDERGKIVWDEDRALDILRDHFPETHIDPIKDECVRLRGNLPSQEYLDGKWRRVREDRESSNAHGIPDAPSGFALRILESAEIIIEAERARGEELRRAAEDALSSLRELINYDEDSGSVNIECAMGRAKDHREKLRAALSAHHQGAGDK